MSEYLKDSDGDVWRRKPYTDVWALVRLANGNAVLAETVLPRDVAEGNYGPLTPCTETGDTLTSNESRTLVAAAFEDFAERLEAKVYPLLAGANPFAQAARETAAAILSGDVQPAGGEHDG